MELVGTPTNIHFSVQRTFFTHHHFCPNTAKYLWLPPQRSLCIYKSIYKRIYVYSSDCGALIFCTDFTQRLSQQLTEINNIYIHSYTKDNIVVSIGE